MNRVKRFYQKLRRSLGPQNWWPARTPFEVMVGAVLTQNTSWKNVEKAIGNLRRKNLLGPLKMHALSQRKLAEIIRPAGYYNIKAKRLKNFLDFFISKYQGNIRKMSCVKTGDLRRDLLAVNGIGPETADSIMLYALNKPVFVVDAYTKRIFSRHNMIKNNATYDEAQELFNKSLKKNFRIFNEYHALLVKIGKEFCLKNKPKCSICPLSPR